MHVVGHGTTYSGACGTAVAATSACLHLTGPWAIGFGAAWLSTSLQAFF